MADPLLTALEIASRVQARRTSAEEVTRDHLRRIEHLDPQLGAFQLVRAEKALAEARELDRRSDLAALPLAGVPVAVKDNMNLAGEPTRLGSAATSDAAAAKDDELVRRVRAAGAILIGKTKLPEFAIFGFTESAAFGVTRNPWNRDRSPGGSTGGGAAAVASGMVPLALATDGGGSIRGPAAFCGVFGLKPSRGLLPLMGDASEHWYGLSVTGPIGTTVADAALLLDVMAGTDRFRALQPLPPRLRVALSLKSPSPMAKAAPEVVAAVRASAEALSAEGHSVTESDPPYSSSVANTWVRLWLAGIAQDVESLDRGRLEGRTRTMARIGRRLGPGSGAAATRWAVSATTWFGDFDVALLPAVAATSIPAGGWSGRGLLATLLPQVKAVPFNQPWNLAGFPAAAVPAGFGPEGVPLSVQVVAPLGREELILSLAAALERLRPWPRVAPAPSED